MIKQGITKDISDLAPVCNEFYLTFISWLFIPSTAAGGWSYFHFK
jgi:hypothetical protein